MNCTKRRKYKEPVFAGKCSHCKSEFEALESEVSVFRGLCGHEYVEYAVEGCTECGGDGLVTLSKVK